SLQALTSQIEEPGIYLSSPCFTSHAYCSNTGCTQSPERFPNGITFIGTCCDDSLGQVQRFLVEVRSAEGGWAVGSWSRTLHATSIAFLASKAGAVPHISHPVLMLPWRSRFRPHLLRDRIYSVKRVVRTPPRISVSISISDEFHHGLNRWPVP